MISALCSEVRLSMEEFSMQSRELSEVKVVREGLKENAAHFMSESESGSYSTEEGPW